jgi:predicted branched-subunit amino acid permease
MKFRPLSPKQRVQFRRLPLFYRAVALIWLVLGIWGAVLGDARSAAIGFVLTVVFLALAEFARRRNAAV